MKRFWSKVDIRGLDKCWEWKAGKLQTGYGKFKYQGKTLLAHRFAFYLVNGHYPKNGCACHTCDNPSCVNPNHLFDASITENLKDRDCKGRNASGERQGHSKLTANQVRQIRKRCSAGELQSTIAKEYDLHKTTISKIIQNINWRSY